MSDLDLSPVDIPAQTRKPEDFPRQYARTRRFSLGAPKAITVSVGGQRAVFLRTPSGTDPRGCLWRYDIATDSEELLADPVVLLAGGDDEDLPPEEQARRERAHEGGAGIVAYACDAAVSRAVFALSGRVFLVDLTGHEPARELPVLLPAIDPRLDPTGQRLAYVSAGALRVLDVASGDDRALVEPDAPEVTWGLADFLAAEEMDRHRAFWWAPTGDALLVERVDERAVAKWYVADPAEPATPAVAMAYPAAGATNPDVSLAWVDLEGTRRDIEWDRAAYPYLARVHWSEHGKPLLQVQSRDQQRTQVLTVELADGTTEVTAEASDPAWIELVAGVPAWTPDGKLVTTADDSDTRRLQIDGEFVTPVGLQVAEVLGVDTRGVLFSANTDPVNTAVWNLDPAGALTRVTSETGSSAVGRTGDLLVVSEASLDSPRRTRLLRTPPEGEALVLHEFVSHAEQPSFVPRVEVLSVGARALSTAVVLPRDWTPEAGPLPVLMDPYGGPSGPRRRVTAARSAYYLPQWFADQGFAVVIVDGRGTGGRGPAWEREIRHDFAGPILTDQIDALQALAANRPYLDLTRVAIQGWSFGGYLAALALLRRPDVFHAAIAGAPVTDWELYDTHYTERYLGTPQEHPEAYARSSIVADAPDLTRPLLLVHGMADPNVVAAHTMRLSSALVAAGKPHIVLPLCGVTHRKQADEVAENLLRLQVAFLRDSLG